MEPTEEKRFESRAALRVSVIVSGHNKDGAAWCEPAQTCDVSTSGALIHLNQRVEKGEQL